jgi:hypothetical protein
MEDRGAYLVGERKVKVKALLLKWKEINHCRMEEKRMLRS